jgi:hypothetical protein
MVSISCSVSAELRLAAERLLRHERVRARRAGVDLVVHEVEQLEDVHEADRDVLLERLARLPVVEPHLAGAAAAAAVGLVHRHPDRAVRELGELHERIVDIVLGRAVEDGCRHRPRVGRVDRRPRVDRVALGEDAVRGRPPEMRLEDLPDVHPARDAERVQDDVHRAR